MRGGHGSSTHCSHPAHSQHVNKITRAAETVETHFHETYFDWDSPPCDPARTTSRTRRRSWSKERKPWRGRRRAVWRTGAWLASRNTPLQIRDGGLTNLTSCNRVIHWFFPQSRVSLVWVPRVPSWDIWRRGASEWQNVPSNLRRQELSLLWAKFSSASDLINWQRGEERVLHFGRSV